jgi:RNA recognition motif-containing protein
MNVFIRNLPRSVDDAGLRARFEQFGTVDLAQVILDRRFGRSLRSAAARLGHHHWVRRAGSETGRNQEGKSAP